MADIEQHESNTRVPDAAESLLKIQEILRLMLAFKYRRGSTAKRLAAQWGVSVGYVHNLASEARKLVRQQLGDPNEMASEVIPGLLLAFRKSVQSEDPKMVANVAPIANQLANLSGISGPQKHEITGKDGGPVAVTGVVILPPEDNEGSCDAQPDDPDDG